MGNHSSDQPTLFSIPSADRLLNINSLEKAEEKELLLLTMENVFNQLLSGPKQELFQTLYRLDVNEERVQMILQGHALGHGGSAKKMSKARALAELTLDREIQKAKTRSEN